MPYAAHELLHICVAYLMYMYLYSACTLHIISVQTQSSKGTLQTQCGLAFYKDGMIQNITEIQVVKLQMIIIHVYMYMHYHRNV